MIVLIINGLPLLINTVSLPHPFFLVLCSLLSSSPSSSLTILSILCSLFYQLHLHSYDSQSPSLSTFKMHFPTFLAVTTALCAASASAGCFQTGQHWGDHGNAKAALADACHGLTGPYDSYQPKYACRDGSSGQSFQFQVNNQNSGKTVSQADCENHIGGIIDQCGHGGDTTVDGVYYRYL